MTESSAVRQARLRLLVTGFGPFAGYIENPSGLIARAVHGQRFGEVEVAGHQIDVSWSDAFNQVAELVEEVSPQALLCLGVAPDENFRLEVIAKNVASDSMDASGQRLERGPLCQIAAEAPAAFFSRLPLEWLLQQMKLRKTRLAPQRDSVADAELSRDAGDYLCNYLYFRVMNELPAISDRGFIHVPSMPGSDGRCGSEVIEAGQFLIRQLASWLENNQDGVA